MNRIGAFKAARKRTPRICALLLVCLTLPTHLAAQTEADREAVSRVVELLFVSAGEFGDEIPHSPGTWSLVVARFARGDSREIAIPAKAGEEYSVMGNTESVRTDIDICIYGPAGDLVDCDDSVVDSVPIVIFTAESEGTYRAVMTAASVVGGGTAFAGMVVLRELDDGAESGGAGK